MMRKIYNEKCKQLLLLWVFSMAISTGLMSQIGSSGWTFSNPRPFGFHVLASSFIDNNNGVIVGDGGAIAKTNDGGVTWGYFSYIFTGSTGLVKPQMNDVQMVTSSVVYAVGNTGVFLKSIDGGLNWTKLPTPLSVSGLEEHINSVSFLDVNTGYICGEPLGTETVGQTALYKTTDGGNTWMLEPGLPKSPAFRVGSGTVASPFYYDSSRPKNLINIRMIRSDLGYASGGGFPGGGGLLWKWDGVSWKDYTPKNHDMGLDSTLSGTRPNQGPQSQVWRAMIIVKDSVVMLGSNSNGVLVRVNTAEPTAKPILRNWSGSPANSPLGLAISSLGKSTKTADGKLIMPRGNTNGLGAGFMVSKDEGWTWSHGNVYPMGSPHEALNISAVSATPGNRLFFGGQFGLVADSMNGVWRRPYSNVKPGAGLNKVRFADANNGATVGGFGTILSTRNGGQTWEDYSNLNDAAAQISYFAMTYKQTDALFLATSRGLVKVSSDQGETFDQLFEDNYKHAANSSLPIFYAMDWLDKQHGWVSSFRGHLPSSGQPNLSSNVIFFTKNGGLTWDSSKSLPSGPWPVINNVAQNYTPQVRDIVFADQNIGYACSNRSSIWKTTDGGINWKRIFQAPDSATFSGSYVSISMIDANTVWVAGNGGKVTRTVDGGATWMDAKGAGPFGNTNINGITAYDKEQAFIFTPGGMMWFTPNGGATWQPQPVPVAVGASNGIMTDGVFTSINPGCGSPICNRLWAVGLGGNILYFGSDKVLPIKFSQLSGSAVSEGNQLFWTAFEQENVKHFEVEGSEDGRKFSTLDSKVYATGLPSSSYTWMHKAAPAANFFYRVKAVEKSGNVFFTNVIAIDNKITHSWKYQVLQNSLVLNNSAAIRGNVTVQVVNTSGQTVAAKSWNHGGGGFNDLMALPPHAHGIHFIRVMNEGTTQTFKVLVP